MAAVKNTFLILTSTLLIIVANYSALATRDIPNYHNIINPITQYDNMIKTRLVETNGQSPNGPSFDCWSALVELKSCTNEIVTFFVNGQADIGPGCCNAIGIITRNCWPTMLSSIGFTAEEGNILRGYCDAASSSISSIPPPPPPPHLSPELAPTPLGLV